jgi:ribosomal-protein-alanine N-acetyltransferase
MLSVIARHPIVRAGCSHARVPSRRGLSISGTQLTLRYADERDAPVLYGLARDPQVTRFFSWGPYRRPEQARAYIARLPRERRDGVRLDFVVEHTEHGVIGVTGLSELSRRDRRATVGTWFGRDWWGSGANAQSKALLAQLAFAHLGLWRLGAYSHPEHTRSAAALRRIGFKREGLLRGYHRHGEAQLDVVVWSLLRSDWEASPLQQVPVRVSGGLPRAWRL